MPSLESRNSKIISAGLIFITLFVYTQEVSDPVNSPKFLALGVLSTLCIGMVVVPQIKYLWENFKIICVTFTIAILGMIISTLRSESPVSQNIYGIYGRNTGFLTQLGFLVICLAILSFQNVEAIRRVVKAFIFAGLVNVFYCFWVLTFGDFINWNNQYKSLLGTFGNPNFISSFFGIFSSVLLSYFLFGDVKFRTRAACLPLVAVTIFLILKTNSIQGLILVVISVFVSLFYKFNQKYGNAVFRIAYLLAGMMVSIFGILGVRGIGPLSPILYQETFNFRIQYWLAGIKMGMKFPFTGVGLDSYGDWYREMRTPTSTTSPGLNVVSNVAHNVYIDAFANGGIILLVGYLIPSILCIRAVLRLSAKLQEYDFIFVTLVSAWITYFIQSIISISQIGLGIWGWTFTALLLAYERMLNNIKLKVSKSSKKAQMKFLGTPVAVLSILLGIIVYIPPIYSDHKFTHSIIKRDALLIQESLKRTYFTPNNSLQLAQAIQIFESSKMYDKAYSISKQAIEFNQRSFDAWQISYYLNNSTKIDKQKARRIMITLDPLNPRWKNLN